MSAMARHLITFSEGSLHGNSHTILVTQVFQLTTVNICTFTVRHLSTFRIVLDFVEFLIVDDETNASWSSIHLVTGHDVFFHRFQSLSCSGNSKFVQVPDATITLMYEGENQRAYAKWMAA